MSETMATSAPSPPQLYVSQTRRRKFKYSPPLKPENSNTFNIISLYYVNSPFGFDSWYRKDFSRWHHIQAGPWICSKSCTLATKGTKCPFISITPLRLRMHASTMLHITQATLLLYTIYISLLHMNTAIIKQFLT